MREPDVAVSTTVAAAPNEVWTALADPVRIASWSPENTGASGAAAGPLQVGATFGGSNRNGLFRWTTACAVVESTPGHAFAFDVSYLGLSVARWRYAITPSGDGCLVEEQWWDRRGPVVKAIGIVGTGVVERASHNEATMRQTLAALRSELESR
jgi:hypothetical protein